MCICITRRTECFAVKCRIREQYTVLGPRATDNRRRIGKKKHAMPVGAALRVLFSERQLHRYNQFIGLLIPGDNNIPENHRGTNEEERSTVAKNIWEKNI